jgi:hypothetical protein
MSCSTLRMAPQQAYLACATNGRFSFVSFKTDLVRYSQQLELLRDSYEVEKWISLKRDNRSLYHV